MGKKVIGVVAGVVALAAVGFGVFTLLGQTKDGGRSNTSTLRTGESANYAAVKACEVLTLEIAKQLEPEAVYSETHSAMAANSADVNVSNCTYVRDLHAGEMGGEYMKNAKSVSLLARSALTKIGVDSNKSQFAAEKPADVQDISGYGDKAFWDQKMGQLHILKGNNWYIVSYASVSGDKTLDDAKKLADLIKDRLK